MKKSELRLMIRKIVRGEVAMSIKEVISEITKPNRGTSKPKRKVVEQKQFTKNPVLNEILNETAAGDEWKTLGSGVKTTNDMADVMAKSYGEMMTNNANAKINVEQMAVESNVNPENVPDHVEQALTRDYSDLMKVINKKDGK